MSRVRVQTPANALRAKSVSPKFEDSPSRQLMLDLERALNQVQLHEVELQKVHTYDRRLFQENLDLLEARRAQEHGAALDAVTSWHDAVRKEAEVELQRYYRKVEEQERLQREEEERRVKQQQAQAKAETERKAREEAERKAKVEREQAAARKAAEEKAKAEEGKRREREEALAREKAEKERKQKEEQESAIAKQRAEDKAARDAAAQEAAKSRATTTAAGPSSTVPSSPSEAQQQRYLAIHQTLKNFRKKFWAQCKKEPALKSKVGDMRRAIRTSVGQLTEAKGANKIPVSRLTLCCFPFA